MRLPRRPTRASVPTEVARSLPLQHGESVLAAAADREERWYVGTGRALLLPEHDGWRRLPWETIERATWDRDSEQLVVVETADFGRPEPTYRATLPDPDRLLRLVRERVTASIVIQFFEPVEGKRGITVSGRRSPHSDDEPTWSVLVDPGLDERSEPVRAAAEKALAAAQSEIGM
ncbi:MAG TPA: hypothetical protein VHG70_18335 [Nocardioidaceae bacterium]|nr:hypothetical protein [Nocardioidaceae bacterium]